MRKVDLRMNEQVKFDVIKSVVNGRKSKQRAEVELDLSRRQIDRLVVKYLKEGKYGFIFVFQFVIVDYLCILLYNPSIIKPKKGNKNLKFS